MNRLIPSTICGLTLIIAAPGSAAARLRADTIPAVLAPIGAEHEALRTQFDAALHRATGPGASRVHRTELVAFLRNRLIPHAQREELVLYPALDSVLGTKGNATAALVLDHRAIANLTLELAQLPDSEVVAFRARAFELAVLVDHHFATEEEFVLPNLARKMTGRSLRALMARLDAERLDR